MSDIAKIIITAIVSALVSGLITYVFTIKRKVKAVANGILSCLRADIINYYNHYMKKKYCPVYAKDAIEKAYQAYHDLGGNGTITGLYKKLMELPEEEEK